MATIVIFAGLIVSLGWVSFVCAVLYAIDVRLSRRFNRFVARRYSRRIFALFSKYMNFRFAGDRAHFDELPPQYMIVSNHQSLFDIPLYMRFIGGHRLRFVAKAELGKNVPIISSMLKSDQHCLVQRRGSPSQAMQAMDAFAARVMANGWNPVIFPEGTRSLDGSLGTFYAAGFRRLADKAPMPVVVCAIDGGWRISSLRRMAREMKGGFYRAKIVKIYPAPTTKAEQLHILEEGKALIQAQLDQWRLQDKQA